MKTQNVKACFDFRIFWTTSVLLVAAAMLFAALAGPLVARAAAAEEGWYTQAQAEHGHQLFNNYCAQCHRPDLTGAMGPALIGQGFLKQWEDKPIEDLFNFAHSKMPAVNPGSVPDDEMWAIVAYILQKNGFPAGQVALNQEESRILKAN